MLMTLTRTGRSSRARLDKGSPAFLAFFALHPILIELDQFVVRLRSHLREDLECVFEYLIVESISKGDVKGE